MDFVADDVIYRRVSSHQIEIDHAPGQKRPTSANFTDSTKPEPSSMSCIADRLLYGRDPVALVPGAGGDLLVALRVADLTAHALIVIEDPTEDEPAHVLVVGSKTRGVRRGLAALSQWIVAP